MSFPFALCHFDTNTCAKLLTTYEGRPAGANVAGWHQQNMSRCRNACGAVLSPYSPYNPSSPYNMPGIGYPEQRLLTYNDYVARKNHPHVLY